MRKVLFSVLSMTFLFVFVWSLAQMSLNVKVKGQGHHRQKRGFQRISWELLNRFARNSHGTRVSSLARNSLKVKVNFSGLRAVYVWKNIVAPVF